MSDDQHDQPFTRPDPHSAPSGPGGGPGPDWLRDWAAAPAETESADATGVFSEAEYHQDSDTPQPAGSFGVLMPNLEADEYYGVAGQGPVPFTAAQSVDRLTPVRPQRRWTGRRVALVAAAAAAVAGIGAGVAVAVTAGGPSPQHGVAAPATSPTPAAAAAWCPSGTTGALTTGNGPGSTHSGPDVIRAFEYGYYTLHSATAVLAVVAPSAPLPDAATVQKGIDIEAPAGTVWCVTTVNLGGNVYGVTLRARQPSGHIETHLQQITTTEVDGRVLIANIADASAKAGQ